MCNHNFVFGNKNRLFAVSCFAGTWIFGDVLCQMYAFTCFTLSLVNYFSKMKHFNFFMRFNNIDFSLRLGRHICIPLHHHLQTPNKYTAIRFCPHSFLNQFTQFALSFLKEYRLTPRLCCFCIIGAITYALIWTVTPFFGWSSYTFEPFGTSCSFDWYNDTSVFSSSCATLNLFVVFSLVFEVKLIISFRCYFFRYDQSFGGITYVYGI